MLTRQWWYLIPSCELAYVVPILLHLCMYVCMYVFVCLCVCIYVRTWSLFFCISVCMYVCMYVFACLCVYTVVTLLVYIIYIYIHKYNIYTYTQTAFSTHDTPKTHSGAHMPSHRYSL